MILGEQLLVKIEVSARPEALLTRIDDLIVALLTVLAGLSLLSIGCANQVLGARGILASAEFIAVAEQTSLIMEMPRHIMRPHSAR